jgi:hypothetical protein
MKIILKHTFDFFFYYYYKACSNLILIIVYLNIVKKI